MCRHFDVIGESSFCIVKFGGEFWNLNKAEMKQLKSFIILTFIPE